MNKTEKVICLVLGLVLAWYLYDSFNKQKEAMRAAAEAARLEAAVAETNGLAAVGATALTTQSVAVARQDAAPSVGSSSVAPQTALASLRAACAGDAQAPVVLENDLVKVEISPTLAAVRKVTLKTYPTENGAVSDANPAISLDFAGTPLGYLEMAGATPFAVASAGSNEVVLANGSVTRTVTLGRDYCISFADAFANPSAACANALCLGAMQMGASKNDLLSVDSWSVGKAGVVHHGDDDSPLKPFLAGGSAVGGCSCSGAQSAAGMPATSGATCPGAQTWIAMKNRFFVTALVSCTDANTGFDVEVARDPGAAVYRPASIAGRANFAGTPANRTSVFYVGPKKQSLLWDLGMKDVMEFGMWRWICYPVVSVLNFFHALIPNYGIAIILLTILVRLVFWPLTRKSTVGMKKMQELQPKMKELQAKFKDNPQRLQQETWALYREAKVNPMSSCLPMLVQIPVFIALFNVLRSAVELRYAPFLWIADLSEPEALFASWFPFGGLNVLPVLMAVSTALQSAFTPSTGDRSQQRMMMVFMPAMMLVMFYSFPSALSLYWFLSNVFSIVQMWLIRRQTAKEQAILHPEVIDPVETRQMRRHQD